MGNWTIAACVAGVLALSCPVAFAQDGDQQVEQPSSATGSPQPTIQWVPQNSHCGGVVRVYMAPPPSWLSSDPVVAGDAIHERRSTVNALCLFEGAYLLADRDVERAGVLFTMARLRSRFDVARCKQPDGAQGYMSVARSREMSPPPALAAAVEADVEANKRWIRAALAEPKMFSDTGNLENICRSGGVRSGWDWGGIEKQLRDSWGKQAQ